MLDVAIIGGGLCGLALAHSLQARGVDWALFEARPRLGGRVLTERLDNGLAVDLGPAWFWPQTQPSIARVIADLGLDTLTQPDDGRVLLLDDPDRPPRALAVDTATGRLLADASMPATPGAVHGGAHRLADGMRALVDAFAAPLPFKRMQLGTILVGVEDRGEHVDLRFGLGDEPDLLQARRVVLAMPPRLVAERIRFAPALPASVTEALAATPTWMATAAKAAVATARPVWRDAGIAGNAWVQHPQGVLAEVFDAGSERDDAGALAGFAALGADDRARYAAAMPMLLRSQVEMLFGPEAAAGDVRWHDWADDAFTCSRADRAEDGVVTGHRTSGDTRLREAQWDGRLWFGGSETAAANAGYLDGALSAAARLRRQLAGSMATA